MQNSIFTLNWVFSNGHEWLKDFSAYDEAESYFYTCSMLKNHSIERVYIVDGLGACTWLKEKITHE